MTDTQQPNMLEAVARAMAFCHFMRGARNPKPDHIKGLVDRRWDEFQEDAHVVIEVINGLVQAEQFQEAIEAVPTLPAFLTEAIN